MSVLDWDNKEYNAYYGSFYVGDEDSKYQLSLSGYDEARSSLPDGFMHGGQHDAPFSTFDQDNDRGSEGNCAAQFSGGKFIRIRKRIDMGTTENTIFSRKQKNIFKLFVGWWHNGCGSVNLNGVNSNSQLNTANPVAYNGIIWYPAYSTLDGRGTNLEPDGGSWATFKATEMRIITDKFSVDFGNA